MVNALPTCWHKRSCWEASRRCRHCRTRRQGGERTWYHQWKVHNTEISWFLGQMFISWNAEENRTFILLDFKSSIFSWRSHLASWSKTSTRALTSRKILTRSMWPLLAARSRGDHPDLRKMQNFGFFQKLDFSLAIGLFLVNSGETTDQRITEAEQEWYWWTATKVAIVICDNLTIVDNSCDLWQFERLRQCDIETL